MLSAKTPKCIQNTLHKEIRTLSKTCIISVLSLLFTKTLKVHTKNPSWRKKKMQKKTVLSVVELLSYQNCKMNEITILVAERDYQKQLFLRVFENLMYKNALYWKSKQHNQKHVFLVFFQLLPL